VSLAGLEESERGIIRQCLRAAADGPFFPDWEFETLFGLGRNELKDILEIWPDVDESEEKVQIAINNTLNNLLGYPHGCEKEWHQFITASAKQVQVIFEKWRGSV
jgi:hypothetical protein